MSCVAFGLDGTPPPSFDGGTISSLSGVRVGAVDLKFLGPYGTLA